MKKISKKETPRGRGSRGVVIVVTDAYLHQLLGKIGKLQTDDAGFTPDTSPPAPPQYGHVSNKSSGSVPFVAPVSNSPEEAEASKAKANEAAVQSPSEMLLPVIANPNNNSMPSIAPEEWIDEIEKLMDILGNDDSIMELLASPLHHPHSQTPPCTFIGSRPVSTFVNVQEIDQAAVEIFDMINQSPEQEIANPNLPSEAWVDECLNDNEAFEERHASIIPPPPPPHYLAVSTPCRHGMGMAMVDHHQAGQTFSTNIRQPKLHSDVGCFTLNNTPPKQLTSPSTSFYDGWTELLTDNEVFRGDYYSLEELLSDPPL